MPGKTSPRCRSFGWLDVRWMLKQMMDVVSFVDIRIGEPVQDRRPAAWHVSVEVSVVKKWNLALRPNNTAKRYIVDGGI